MNCPKRFTPFFLLSLGLIVMGFGSVKLIKTKLAQGITVSLPAELKPMIPDDVALRFPSVRAPLGAFTNEDRQVDFMATVSATQWPDQDLEMAKEFFKAGVYNMYDRIEIISEGVREIHGRKFIYFEFQSRINAGKVKGGFQQAIVHYSFLQYFVESKRSLVFSFTCPSDRQQELQPVAREIMQSIRF